jgi:predicted amidohydrolase YtcJ
LVLPGFIDPHLHLTDTARRRAGVELRGSRNLPELATRISRHLAREPEGPIWGGGWDEGSLQERRMPSRTDLDRWLPDRPLLLHRSCLHVAVLNSAALEAMGIDRSVPDPPGGSIERDGTGEPTGVLRESALTLLDRFPFPDPSDRPELLETVYEEACRSGIVALASMRATEPEIAWVERRAETVGHRPAPRYRAFGRIDVLGDIPRWTERAGRRASVVSGVKLFVDGSLGARSAWLERPYDDAPKERGASSFPTGELEEAVRLADVGGLRVSAHAIGDRALHRILEAFSAARPDRRPRIEHASLVAPSSWPLLKAVGADIVVQPGFRTSDGWLAERIGKDRLASAYPIARLRATGVAVAGSSDAPVEPLDPISGMRSAIAVDGMGETVSIREALAMYTSDAARVLETPDLGTLEPGAAASLVVLSLREIEELASADQWTVLETWIDGRCAVGPLA